MNIRITPPEADDIKDIIALYAITWLATYPNEEQGITYDDIKQKTDAMQEPERVEKFNQNLLKDHDDPTQFYVVAKIEGRVVGVCGGFEKEDRVHMASLYVLPSEQGKGIGARLMEEFFIWANPHKATCLHVVTYNTNAIRFYEKWGFQDTGKRFTEERYLMASGNSFPEMEMERKSKSPINV